MLVAMLTYARIRYGAVAFKRALGLHARYEGLATVYEERHQAAQDKMRAQETLIAALRERIRLLETLTDLQQQQDN